MTFSVFLIISTLFWFAATAYQKSDTTISVKLVIEGQPASAVFTTHVPSELKVTLYDTNSKLFRYSYNKEIKELTVDFMRYADVAGNFRISGAELQSLMLNNLKSTTQITAISPALVDARYAMTGGRKVPVRINGVITSADNYRDYKPVIVPDSVIVHAPSYILDTLKFVYTTPFYKYGLKDTLRVHQAIELAVGVKSTPDTVHITVPVVQYVEKKLDNIKVRPTDLPNGKKMTVFPREVSLTMLASFNQYSQIAPSDFDVTVSYDSIHSHQQQFLPIHITCKFDSTVIQRLQVMPERVEYSIDE